MRPWMGSTTKAATSPPRSSASTRSRSPNGTRAQPGSSGPKPSWKKSSPTSESGPSVTPWKPLSHETSRGRELHRRVDRLGAGAGEERGVQAGRQPPRELLGQHPGESRGVDLHDVD